jgi:hypothetical protein
MRNTALIFCFFMSSTLQVRLAHSGESTEQGQAKSPIENSTNAASDSCTCPKLKCDKACEVEKEMTFYSEKCAGGTRVKSCSRPSCAPKSDAQADCQKSAKVEHPATLVETPEDDVARAPASKPENEKPGVGVVKFIEGKAYIFSSPNATLAEKTPITAGSEVHEQDHVETDSTGKVQIAFNSGNLLNITPNSELVITEGSDSLPMSKKKRMILDLIKGKIRNKVNQKYDGEESFYKVRTKSAVAGVRGTDFTIGVMSEDNEHLMSKVETLMGKVELSGIGLSEKSHISVGESGSFISDATGGRLTPVLKMSAEQISILERDTMFASLTPSLRKPASQLPAEVAICSNPSGKMNSCSWVCEQNPVGQHTCRTDLPGVSCVRRMCNANGAWSDAMRLPASQKENCLPDQPVVKSCDY